MKAQELLNSRHLVDQVFLRGAGWFKIDQTPMRQLLWRKNARRMRIVEAVHFMEFGDYTLAEMKGGNS